MPVELSNLEAIPDVIAISRALAEAHRLDLALFVAFEELSVRIAESLSRHRLNADVLNLLLEQARDDARHLEQFRHRLDLTLSSTRPDRASDTEAMLLRVLKGSKASSGSLQRDEVVSAIVTPRLQSCFDTCQAVADRGSTLETLVMFHLVHKGMAWSLNEYEARYWQPVDPFLAQLIRSSSEEEHHHITRTAQLISVELSKHPDQRVKLARLGEETVAMLRDAFHYYIRKLVTFFAVVKSQHPDRYAEDEFTVDQMVTIGTAGTQGVAQILRQAGLDYDGQQESLSHE